MIDPRKISCKSKPNWIMGTDKILDIEALDYELQCFEDLDFIQC